MSIPSIWGLRVGYAKWPGIRAFEGFSWGLISPFAAGLTTLDEYVNTTGPCFGAEISTRGPLVSPVMQSVSVVNESTFRFDGLGVLEGKFFWCGRTA